MDWTGLDWNGMQNNEAVETSRFQSPSAGLLITQFLFFFQAPTTEATKDTIQSYQSTNHFKHYHVEVDGSSAMISHFCV